MNNKYDIHERIYQFVLEVLRYIKKLSKTYENQILTNQLIRAVTSVGANDQEADGSLTKADFMHCYTIVRKEGKETLYWLRLIGDCNINHKQEGSVLIDEGNEIIQIVTAIIFKTKKKK